MGKTEEKRQGNGDDNCQVESAPTEVESVPTKKESVHTKEDFSMIDEYINHVIEKKNNSTCSEVNKKTSIYLTVAGIIIAIVEIALFLLLLLVVRENYISKLLIYIFISAILLIIYGHRITQDRKKREDEYTDTAEKYNENISIELYNEACRYLYENEQKKKGKILDTKAQKIAFCATIFTIFISIIKDFDKIKENVLKELSYVKIIPSVDLTNPMYSVFVILLITFLVVLLWIMYQVMSTYENMSKDISIPLHDYYNKDFVCKQIIKLYSQNKEDKI